MQENPQEVFLTTWSFSGPRHIPAIIEDVQGGIGAAKKADSLLQLICSSVNAPTL